MVRGRRGEHGRAQNPPGSRAEDEVDPRRGRRESGVVQTAGGLDLLPTGKKRPELRGFGRGVEIARQDGGAAKPLHEVDDRFHLAAALFGVQAEVAGEKAEWTPGALDQGREEDPRFASAREEYEAAPKDRPAAEDGEAELAARLPGHAVERRCEAEFTSDRGGEESGPIGPVAKTAFHFLEADEIRFRRRYCGRDPIQRWAIQEIAAAVEVVGHGAQEAVPHSTMILLFPAIVEISTYPLK